MPSRDEPTSVNARQPSAVKNAASPIAEIACPDQRRRKSRCANARNMRRSIAAKLSCAVVMDVRAVVERWSLTLGEPYEQGAAGYTTRVTLSDGTPAVLKLSTPHRESEHEGDALRAWDGDGAIRLLAHEGDALLLERCEPWTPLWRLGPDAALDVLIGLLPRLWIRAAEPFHTLADEAAGWYPPLPLTKLGGAAPGAIGA